jgi:hypothetical protein
VKPLGLLALPHQLLAALEDAHLQALDQRRALLVRDRGDHRRRPPEVLERVAPAVRGELDGELGAPGREGGQDVALAGQQNRGPGGRGERRAGEPRQERHLSEERPRPERRDREPRLMVPGGGAAGNFDLALHDDVRRLAFLPFFDDPVTGGERHPVERREQVRQRVLRERAEERPRRERSRLRPHQRRVVGLLRGEDDLRRP